MLDPIQKLRQVLENGDIGHLPKALPPSPGLDYALLRFGHAYNNSKILGPDEILLLRQLVRWSGMDSIKVNRPHKQSDEFAEWLDKAGLTWTPDGCLSAEAYAPDWLLEKPTILDSVPKDCTLDESFLGEFYLKQFLNFDKWLSPAQKEAVWTVNTSSDGTTHTIVLPTGSGKSACFWLLPLISTGLTVVVVPTIALAMDQQRSATERYKHSPGINPSFYAADDDPENTIQRLSNREVRLLFASPETCVSGRLRRILDNFARSGWFHNLVIDEAHLIETWGSLFRVAFQVLAAARNKWIEESGKRLRTFLFSATMSPQCRKTLSDLFAFHDSAIEYNCQRLRPEMNYFSRHFSTPSERWPFLREAIWHMPRPAIIYLTRPADAEALYHQLKEQEGFKRIGCFSGETRRVERRQLLDDWKDNRKDLMVATSAFGVGVDKPDVRTVIHACYPENLERYYQEVGRSGRDGYGAVCILMPAERDKQIARSLGTKMLSDETTIQRRWEAMYLNRKGTEEGQYIIKLPVASRRLELKGERTYSRNIEWNKSLLLQLFRAGLLDLLDIEYVNPESENEEPEEWAKVRIKFPPGTLNLSRRFEEARQKERTRFEKSFYQLEELFSDKCCISRVLQKTFKITSDQRLCGGCRYCRANDLEPVPCPPLPVPESRTEILPGKGLIIDNWPDPYDLLQKDEFLEKVDILLTKYSLKPFAFYCCHEHFAHLLRILEPVFRSYHEFYRFDQVFPNTRLRCLSGQTSLFLHVWDCSEDMLIKGSCGQSVHLFCGIKNNVDLQQIKIKYNCNLWASPDIWLENIT